MKTEKPEKISLLEQALTEDFNLTKEDDVQRRPYSFMQRIAAGITMGALYLATALGGGAALTACGPDGNGNAINPIPAGYSVVDNVTPANGSTFGASDNPLRVSVRTPQVSAECAADAECADAAAAGGTATVTATYDNATPGNPGDDETVTIMENENVNFDQTVSRDIDFASAHGGAGLADGEKLTLEATIVAVDSEGESHEVRGSVAYTFEGGATGPRVTGCNVAHSNVGTSLAIDCTCSQTAESWGLTGGPSGTIITSTGTIGTGRGMAASDVGLHTYHVTCTAGGVVSPDYVLTIPVDEHESRLVLHCSSGTNNDLLLQETSVDAVASACGTGFNPALKPSTSSASDYVMDVNKDCVQGAIAALSADERAAHEHYNNGTTVPEVYSTCTVDFAQVRYHSDN
jgi:hypothetical protein